MALLAARAPAFIGGARASARPVPCSLAARAATWDALAAPPPTRRRSRGEGGGDADAEGARTPWHPARRVMGAPTRALLALLVATGFKSSRHKLGYWRRVQQKAARSRGLAAAQSLQLAKQDAEAVALPVASAAEPAAPLPKPVFYREEAVQASVADSQPASPDLAGIMTEMAMNFFEEMVCSFMDVTGGAQQQAQDAGRKISETASAAGASMDGARAATQKMADEAGAKARQAGKDMMEGGAWYQNTLGSVLNDRGVPISITVHITEDKHVNLKVGNLNSINNGSEGWFAFDAKFRLLPTGEGDKMKIKLESEEDTEAFVFDNSVLERGASFAFNCLKRAGGAVLNALALEWDAQKNCIVVTPQARVVRLLWWEPVVLAAVAGPEAMWQPEMGALVA